jgi:2-polyprenyl-3-methyl-5-hydroxy-6-metoxy-1,4-benzoquinol methylase
MPLLRRRFDQAYFDSLLYRSHPLSRRNVMRLDLVLAHKDHGRLLDIGSGRGDFLELAASRFDVKAIDLSPYAASRLRSTLGDRVTTGDVESILLPGQSYDVVTAFNVLEHLRRPSEVIRKVSTALAPDGIFIGSVPCNAGLIGSLHTAITNYFDRTHRSCYKVAAWRKAFRKADLADTHFFGESMIGGSISTYIFTPLWPHLSLNMMFLSRKPSSSRPA